MKSNNTMKKIIYADHAATTKLDKDALSAMYQYLTEEYFNPSQPYSFSKTSKKAIFEARNIIARCINANPEEIYFTSGGTESDNWAIKNIFMQKKRRKLIVSNIEHHAILNSCQAVQNSDEYAVDFVLSSSNGYIEGNALEKHLQDNNVYMTSVMLANNEIGTIQPVKELAAIAHKYGSIFHTDAVQAIGHIPVDVKDLDVDMLSASAHKFNGPKGIGFMYIKNGTPIASLINGGSQEYGLRAGTENVASIVGMSVALEKNYKNCLKNMEFLSKLEDFLILKLKEAHIDFVCNSGKKHIPGNISLSFRNMQGEVLLHRLDLKGICVSTGSACDGSKTQISHVIKAIGLDDEYAKGTIRISLGIDNSVEDVLVIVDELVKIIRS